MHVSPVRGVIPLALDRPAELWIPITTWTVILVLFALGSPASAQLRGDSSFTGIRVQTSIRVAIRDSSVVLVAVEGADSLVAAADPAAVRLWADYIRPVLLAASSWSDRTCEGYEGACSLRVPLVTLKFERVNVYAGGAWGGGGEGVGVTMIRRYFGDDSLFSKLGAAEWERFIFTIRRAASEADSMRAQPLAGAFEADSIDKLPMLIPESGESLALLSSMLEGGGVLEVVVTPEGTVERPSIRLVGFYDEGWEQLLKSDAEQLRFTPGERNGNRVRVRMRIPVGYSPYAPFWLR